VEGISILQFLRLFLIFPYLYGLGYVLGRVIFGRGDIAFSVFLSLTVWSVLGWFSFGYLKLLSWFLTFLGAFGMLWGFRDLLKEWKILLGFLTVILLRFLIISPLSFPYGNDAIMHVYTTSTIINHGGFYHIFEPFGVEGMGSFNLGFHYISASLSYITGLDPASSVILTAYIFWGTLFLAVNSFVNSPLLSVVITFTSVGISTFMAWGGFPTLASYSFSIFAFSFNGYLSIPFWLGAFSTHFITSSTAFLSYLVANWKNLDKKFLLGLIIIALILSQQYFRIVFFGSEIQPYENFTLNRFVLDTFKKSALFSAIYIIFAFWGYKKYPEIARKVPPISASIPLIFGLLSFFWAFFDLTPHQIKGFYLIRVLVPLVIPAFMGIKWFLENFKILTIPTFFLGFFTIYIAHKNYSKDPQIWEFVKTFKGDGSWVFVKYRSEEAFLPMFGVPAYSSHYIITQLHEFKERAKEEYFGYIFLREDEKNPAVLEVVKKYGVLMKDFGKLKVYKLRERIKGSFFIRG